jgi:hypothetical protein
VAADAGGKGVGDIWGRRRRGVGGRGTICRGGLARMCLASCLGKLSRQAWQDARRYAAHRWRRYRRPLPMPQSLRRVCGGGRTACFMQCGVAAAAGAFAGHRPVGGTRANGWKHHTAPYTPSLRCRTVALRLRNGVGLDLSARGARTSDDYHPICTLKRHGCWLARLPRRGKRAERQARSMYKASAALGSSQTEQWKRVMAASARPRRLIARTDAVVSQEPANSPGACARTPPACDSGAKSELRSTPPRAQ